MYILNEVSIINTKDNCPRTCKKVIATIITKDCEVALDLFSSLDFGFPLEVHIPYYPYWCNAITQNGPPSTNRRPHSWYKMIAP